MSTNGFVGIGTPTHWTARYNHADSWPTGLGRAVWQTLQDFRSRDHSLDGFIETLLHVTNWRDVATQGVYHQHSPDALEKSAITPDTCDWLFMEWGYVVDPAPNLFHVFVGCIPTPLTYTVDIYRPDGSHEIWADKPRYTGVLAGSYDIAGPEPVWPLVDRMGHTLRDQLAAEFAANPHHLLLDAVRARPSHEVWDQRAPSSS